MSKKEFVKKFFSGLFFVVGIILILSVIFVIGKERGFTEKKFQFDVLFRDVGGLIEGAPVQLAGVNIGTVSGVNFLDKEIEGCRVKVRLNIFQKYRRQLNRDVRFTIKTEGILGEKLVEIVAGKGGLPLDLGSPIIGEDPMNVQDLAEVFADAAQSFTRASEDFNKVDVQDLSRVLADTAKSLSKTSDAVNDVLSEMYYISIKSKRLLDRLEQKVIEGDLFKVF